MTREEIIDCAADNLIPLRRRVKKKVRGISTELLDDCVQEGFLYALEDWKRLQPMMSYGVEAGRVIVHEMEKAVGRFLYAVKKERGLSLNHPVSEEPEAAELGEFVVDASLPDLDEGVDAHRVAESLVVLTSREANILMAFAEDVPLDDIAVEHEMTVEEILAVKRTATDKVKARIFAKALAKHSFRLFNSNMGDIADLRK